MNIRNIVRVAITLLLTCPALIVFSQSQHVRMKELVKEQKPELYKRWYFDLLESRINKTEFVVSEITLVRNETALSRFDLMVNHYENSFFELQLFPIERNTITHFGRVEMIISNLRMKTETKIAGDFIISAFSTMSLITIIPTDGNEPLAMALQSTDKDKILIEAGGSNFYMRSKKNDYGGSPVAVNKLYTHWNENGLKGNVKEAFTKIFEIEMTGGVVSKMRPIRLNMEQYNNVGLLNYFKDWERNFAIERNISGTFSNRVIKESMGTMEPMKIEATLVVKGDSGRYESFVNNKFLLGRKSIYANGRPVNEKIINYLGGVEEEIKYTYYENGNVLSRESMTRNEMYSLGIYKYLKFDEKGNWLERIVYNSSSEPTNLEVRQLKYY